MVSVTACDADVAAQLVLVLVLQSVGEYPAQAEAAKDCPKYPHATDRQ